VRSEGRLARLGPWLLAAAGGALWAACFGARPLTLAPWLALAPLFLVLGAARSRRGAFGLGWLWGTATWLVAIPWIAPTLVTFGHLPSWLSYVLLVALALYLALFTAAFAALGLPLWRRGGALALIGLPGLWIALEWLRSHLFSGFPWNLTGYAWTGVPGALPLAAWVGVWGVGFLAVAVNASVAHALARRRWRIAALWPLVALLLLPLAGRGAPAEAEGTGHEAGDPVRIVQPAIYNQVDYDPEVTRIGYERLLRMSTEACDRPGALVLWPESATWPFELERDPLLARDARRFVESTGCSLLLNSTHRVPDGAGGEAYFNSAYVVAPGGEVSRYDKRHLVPFGEYVPLAGVFSFIDSLARNAGDYSAADEVRLLPWRGERIGTAICFEVTFPGEVAELVRGGATALVTITNDAWYGDTWAPWQHFRAARWRAAEARRPLLRAAVTGVSGVIGPDGSVRRVLGVGETGILRARIEGRTDLTPFVRAPWAVPALSVLATAFAIIAGSRRSTS
jgi:apolipoprotein N-acyltransferase